MCSSQLAAKTRVQNCAVGARRTTRNEEPVTEQERDFLCMHWALCEYPQLDGTWQIHTKQCGANSEGTPINH